MVAQNLFDLFDLLKTDRRGKFQLMEFRQTLDMLEYYLFVIMK